MRIVVLGAGLIGVASAWFLAEDGHEVTVVDRQPGPALETSHANGGQISTSHAEPWANPAAPMKILQWLGREDSPLLWRLRADPAQWAWGLRFLRECTPTRTRANIRAILALALDSRARLKVLRQALGLEYDARSLGILHFYTDEAEFAHAIPQAALMREFGCDRVVRTAAECLAIEPALAHSIAPIVGGTYTPDDESGDAHYFTTALAERCVAQRAVVSRRSALLAVPASVRMPVLWLVAAIPPCCCDRSAFLFLFIRPKVIRSRCPWHPEVLRQRSVLPTTAQNWSFRDWASVCAWRVQRNSPATIRR